MGEPLTEVDGSIGQWHKRLSGSFRTVLGSLAREGLRKEGEPVSGNALWESQEGAIDIPGFSQVYILGKLNGSQPWNQSA